MFHIKTVIPVYLWYFCGIKFEFFLWYEWLLWYEATHEQIFCSYIVASGDTSVLESNKTAFALEPDQELYNNETRLLSGSKPALNREQTDSMCYTLLVFWFSSFWYMYYYRPPEGGRLYDMKVVSGYAFLRTYYV